MNQGYYPYKTHRKFCLTDNPTPTGSILDRFLTIIELIIPAIVAGIYWIISGLFYFVRFIIFTPVYYIGRLLKFIGEKGLGI